MSALQSFFRLLLTIDFSGIGVGNGKLTWSVGAQTDLETQFLIEDALTDILSLPEEQIQYHGNRLAHIGQNLLELEQICIKYALASSIGEAGPISRFFDKEIDKRYLFISTNVPVNKNVELNYNEYFYLAKVIIDKFFLASAFRFKIEQFTNIKIYFDQKKAEILRKKIERQIENVRPNDLNCKLSIDQVKGLHKSLVDKEYITRTTEEITFNEVFFGLVPLKKPVKWIPSLELFSYLFYQMVERGMFSKSTWKSIIENRQLFTSEEGTLITAQSIQLANGRNKKKKNGKPNDSVVVDLILDELNFSVNRIE